MKYRWDKKYLYWGLTAFAVIVCSMLFFFALLRFDQISGFVGMLIGILKPILYGLVIAYLLEPVMSFLERHIYSFLQKRQKSPRSGSFIKFPAVSLSFSL